MDLEQEDQEFLAEEAGLEGSLVVPASLLRRR
jgi:hypothetical protein